MMISGLASGIDTEELITQMMALERRPMVQMQERRSTLLERSNAYRDVNMRLSGLASRVEDLTRLSSFEGKTVNSTNDAVATASASTSAAVGSYDLVIEDLARSHRIASDEQSDTTSELGLAGNVEINGETVSITNEMTLRDVRDAINEADIGVNASIVSATLVLESEETGVENAIELVDSDGIFQALGIVDGGNISNELQAAQDARLSINGLEFIRSSNSIDDLVNGVTFALTSEGSATIKVDHDTDETIAAVKAFVDQYNSAQSFIGSKLEKDAILQGDVTLMQLQSSLQIRASDSVTSSDVLSRNSLSMVGITIDRNREMSLDVNKLRQALETNPDEVRKLFTATEDDDGFDGVAVRMGAFLEMYTKSGTGILSNRQQTYQDQMESIKDSMDRMERRVEIRERNLRQQFAAMEKAISSLQGISASLGGQLNQLAGLTA